MGRVNEPDPFFLDPFFLEEKPESLNQLARITGRAPSNLSHTLKTMESYELVDMQRELRTVRRLGRLVSL